MKKLFIILVVILSNATITISQNHFFEGFDYSRVNSDFNGSVSIGNTFLVYGNGGVIERSTDRGMNWERINLNDSLNVLDILNVGSKLIGICSNNNAITSIDGGKTWEIKFIGSNLNFSQLKLKNNQFYILLKNKVWITDLDFKLVKEYTILTDTSNPSFNLINNSIVYNSGNGNLGVINLQNNQQKLIEISKAISCTGCNISSKIKTNSIDLLYFALGTKLYEFSLLTEKMKLISTLSKSKGYGIDVYNNEIYYVISRTYPSGLDSISFLKYDKINSKIQNIKKSKNDFYIRELSFTDLNFISKDTIISVGKNNLIYISFNGGIDWELKSFLGNFFKMFKFNSNEAVSVGSYGQMFRTNNYGTTWLPQENFPSKIANDERFGYPGNYNGTIHFKDSKNGFISVSPDFVGDTSIVYTNNGGKTAKLADKNDIHYYRMNSFALTLSNKYLYFNCGLVAKGVGTYSIIFSLDDTLGIIKKSNLKAIELFYATMWRDNIYAIGYDSLETKNNYSIFKSIDFGINWTKEFNFQVENPIYLNPQNMTIIDNNLFANWFTIEIQGKDTIGVQNLYKIDLENNKSKKIFSKRADGLWEIFKLKDKYYFGTYSYPGVGIEFKLNFTDNINSDNIEWKTNISSRFGATNILSSANDSSFAISIFDTLSNNYAIYFVNPKSKTSVNSQTEDQTYFYSYPPFPIPAMNELKSLIYWDMSYNIDDSEIGIFDIYGNKVADRDKLSINKLNSYSGYLTWDCSGISTGVYMIQIKHGTNTHNIRAMVMR